MDLEGRVALVTGANRGTGAAIAEGLAHDGADVAVGYRSDGDAASRVVSRVQRAGRRAVAVGGDLRETRRRWAASGMKPRARWGRWTCW